MTDRSVSQERRLDETESKEKRLAILQAAFAVVTGRSGRQAKAESRCDETKSKVRMSEQE